MLGCLQGAFEEEALMGCWRRHLLAFAPDGKTLASASKDQTVRLWDRATGRKRHTLRGHEDQVLSIAFAPDGKTLASGGSTKDPTVRLWDAVAGLPLATLGRHASFVYYQALAALYSDPERAVAVLQRRLRPAAGPEAKRLARLLADLDSDRFADRDKATRELEKLGRLAEPALRRLLADPPSLEVRIESWPCWRACKGRQYRSNWRRCGERKFWSAWAHPRQGNCCANGREVSRGPG
jgi:hypothetical protein